MSIPLSNSLHEHPRAIALLYKDGHVDELERYWSVCPQERVGSLVVALTPAIEARLAERGIPYISAREYRSLDTSRFMLADTWTETWLASPAWKWFQYRDVALSPVFGVSLHLYIVELLYYTTILENLLAKFPSAHQLVLFPPQKEIPLKGSTLVRQQIGAVVDCARLVAGHHGIEVHVPQGEVRREESRSMVFPLEFKEALVRAVIHIYNGCVALLRPRRGSPKILASDYWRNVAPIMQSGARAELMLFDRKEVFKVRLRDLLRFRVRLYNFDSYSIGNHRQARAAAQKEFEERWSAVRHHGLPHCSVKELSLLPLITQALDAIVLHAVPQALRDIDGAYALLHTLSPDIVLLRTSVSAQTHFAILAQAARASGVPSLELQHGAEYLGPGSYSKRHSAEYIAVFGQAVQDDFVALGFSREKIPIVGSPRFDAYTRISQAPHTHENKLISFLCIGSTVAGGEYVYDEYDLEDYYSAIARALEKIPNASAVIKLRPGEYEKSRALVDRIFAKVPHTIAGYEPLPELFASADIVVSYYSTVVFEALQFSKPTVVFSAQSMEKESIRLHLMRYADAGGLTIAYTQEELEEACRSLANDSTLRDRLARGARETLSRSCLFDGGASERIVELIERLSRTKK